MNGIETIRFCLTGIRCMKDDLIVEERTSRHCSHKRTIIKGSSSTPTETGGGLRPSPRAKSDGTHRQLVNGPVSVLGRDTIYRGCRLFLRNGGEDPPRFARRRRGGRYESRVKATAYTAYILREINEACGRDVSHHLFRVSGWVGCCCGGTSGGRWNAMSRGGS
jgi:hypothetical protein